MKYVLCVLILINCSFKSYDCSKETNSLKLVQILFRHGDRTPTETYPNDPHKYWPDGWGQLTKVGKMQMYQLGLKFRKMYEDFLSEYYTPDKVEVKSSYADRCLMSAELMLAGLFPPVKDQIWNSDLLWQPIPVKYSPRKLDNLIALKMDCPIYDAAFGSISQSDRINQINEDNKELYAYLTKSTGKNVKDISTIETLYNTLEIEKNNNLSLPTWTKNISFDLLHKLAAENLALYTDTLLMKRLKGGALLKEIVTQMSQKSENTLKPNKDLFLYSGHDLTIVTLMRTLGFNNLLKPQFGAFLIFELHEIDGIYQVKVLYSNDATSTAENLQLEFCTVPCPLSDFADGLKSVLPINWNQECIQ